MIKMKKINMSHQKEHMMKHANGTEVSIIIPDDIIDFLNYIIQCLRNTMPISTVYLFGSFATGKFNEDSDLDIFIVTKDKSKETIDWEAEAYLSFERRIRVPIDLLVS
jgi:predicted nucleotidyltransferase